MIIVDMKCTKCKKVYTDIFYDRASKFECEDCGAPLVRLFGFRKYPEYPEGYYENFDHEPLYIKDRQHFYKEAKKRGLEPYVPKIAKERKKNKNRKVFL